MAKDETPPTKGIPPAVYALAGTIVTALVGVVVVYFQVITPKLIELHATQTAEILHINLTDTALARIPTSTPTFTLTAMPATFTPTQTPTSSTTPDSLTVTPTFTTTPTRTEAPDIAGSEYCVNARSIYVREGPGTDYSYFGALTFQDCPFFDARNPESTWIRISLGQPGYETLGGGWVRSDLVRPSDFELLPVIEPTPTPTPTDTPEPSSTPTLTNTPEG
jgi:hypothetical protein